MPGKFHDKTFPGESRKYRAVRDHLLAEEVKLRRQLQAVAALRRKLPLGGKLKKDYLFEEGGADLRDQKKAHRISFSKLFEKGKGSLIVYSFMYSPDAKTPCPMCTSLLDSLNGAAPHVRDRVNLVVVAKAPIQKIRRWATSRRWQNLRLLSSGANTYNSDYFAEAPNGSQMPALNVFRKTKGGIYHWYNAELFYTTPEKGQHPRHLDMIWPMWNLFDFTPEGRGENWYPKFSYD